MCNLFKPIQIKPKRRWCQRSAATSILHVHAVHIVLLNILDGLSVPQTRLHGLSVPQTLDWMDGLKGRREHLLQDRFRNQENHAPPSL